MKEIEQKIADQIKDAMRAKEQVRLDTLRAMKSALKYKFVEKNQQELSEAECFAVFQTLIKQRKESIEQFEKANMLEMAEKEKAEMAVIQSFMPQPLSKEELESLVKESIQKTGAKELKDMGLVMKALSAQTAGRTDGKTLSEMVRLQLSNV